MRYLVYILFFLSIDGLMSQNLVPNGSFEEYARQNNKYFEIKNWYRPTSGSSDFFKDTCCIMGVPPTFFGYQKALKGKGFAGFYAFSDYDYREYIQNELTEKLKPECVYLVEFYVSLSDKSKFSSFQIGALLTDSAVTNYKFSFLAKNDKNIINQNIYDFAFDNFVPQINNDKNNFLTDKINWTKVSGLFTAKGGEKFITIGNFFRNTETPIIIVNQDRDYKLEDSYYYIDEVSVKLVNDSAYNSKFIYKSYKPGDIVTLKNVYFETNKFEILPSSYKELNNLYELLKKESNIEIELNGHSDSIGKNIYNEKLSYLRAKSVADFLIKKGINNKRITFKGYGMRMPVSNNKTENNKQKNRRVEFIIKKM